MEVIPFLLDASIGIEYSAASVQLIINEITFLPDASIGVEHSTMSVLVPIDVLSNGIPAIPIQSANPMWPDMIVMLPTVPDPIPLEALLGCYERLLCKKMRVGM